MTMAKHSTELPSGWRPTELSEIAVINPTIDKASIPDTLEVSFVPMSGVQAGTGGIDVSQTRLFGEVRKGYTPFQEGDVLFAKITPCMENGKMAVVPELKSGVGFGSTEFHVLRPRQGISKNYLYYYVSSESFRREAEHNMSGAVGQRRVTTPYLTACDLPLPPQHEQHRIVAKIEELFSELDKGIESLKTAEAQLKVYRQALLKHAFEGKLSVQWRADNPDKLETADALLKSIQQKRAQRYQQQLADWETSGKQGSKPKAPKLLRLLAAEESAELPELPTGWAYTYLAEVGDLGRGKSKHRPRNDPRLFGGIYPFLQTGEVRAANRIIRKYSNTYNEFGLQQSKLWPTGTLCITIAANIAETAFLGFDACFPDSVVGFSAFKKVVLPEYVNFFIQGVRTRIEAYAPATAQKNINLETLENLVIPYCGLDAFDYTQLIRLVRGRT
ncbi:type I restriction-modification system specificity determinant [Caballeronia choica]|uniref:Type I restriction-modification system specificity determinant n=1 Tax=Caballeronia choica TaxID=326476 RepID=A0A158L4Z0_9BURK|nr:restriction endonuclease subunit S [Caballeronia choica]SAL88059.1 type I restriction-modification system specificity determinant [Caballeronia choica]